MREILLYIGVISAVAGLLLSAWDIWDTRRKKPGKEKEARLD